MCKLLSFVIIPICLFIQTPANSHELTKVYMPLITSYETQLGIQLALPQTIQTHKDAIDKLSPDWIVTWIKWSEVEKIKGTYDWSSFEPYYRSLALTDANIMITLKMSPEWARTGSRTCDRINIEHIPDFATFALEAQRRYPRVNYWEIGNEVDAADGFQDYYGCWGNPDEPYYGGGYYASVINPVRSAILSVNPNAKIYAGGFMFPCMDCLQGEYLKGAIISGAQFDGVSFHQYAWYPSIMFPTDKIELIRSWTKAPIIISETSLLGTVNSKSFKETQAEYLEFIYNKANYIGIQALIWYSLEDAGWYNSSMFDGSYSKPVYKKMIDLLYRSN